MPAVPGGVGPIPHNLKLAPTSRAAVLAERSSRYTIKYRPHSHAGPALRIACMA